MKAVTFKPRHDIPYTGNPYYNRQASGGYNPCIKGNPTIDGLDCLCNCVGYAVGRFNEIIGAGNCLALGSINAEDMLELAIRQGYKVTTEPYLGGMMVWSKGKLKDGSDGAGHVAIVEDWQSIKGKTVVMTSESGYRKKGAKTGGFDFKVVQRTGKNWSQGSAYAYAGCIINPAVRCPYLKPTHTIKYGETGDAVRWLQWHLIAHGYDCGTSGIDGRFGPKTRNAVGLFQQLSGLFVDHAVGRLTKAALMQGIYYTVEV